MILLVTNVISEVMRSNFDSTVKAWMDNQIRGEIRISAIAVEEVLYGIKSLPDGKKENQLLEAAAEVFGEYFDDSRLTTPAYLAILTNKHD